MDIVGLIMKPLTETHYDKRKKKGDNIHTNWNTRKPNTDLWRIMNQTQAQIKTPRIASPNIILKYTITRLDIDSFGDDVSVIAFGNVI